MLSFLTGIIGLVLIFVTIINVLFCGDDEENVFLSFCVFLIGMIFLIISAIV